MRAWPKGRNEVSDRFVGKTTEWKPGGDGGVRESAEVGGDGSKDRFPKGCPTRAHRQSMLLLAGGPGPRAGFNNPVKRTTPEGANRDLGLEATSSELHGMRVLV